MAHQMLPAHRPHDQLRTEPAKQREHTDKYVSCFASGNPAVDLTFKNPILQKSADHFKVGVDDLTVNLGSLSMLEYGVGDVVFRIIRRGLDNEFDPNFLMVDGPDGDLAKWRKAFSFSVDRIYNTLQEVLSRFEEIGQAVSTYIRTYGLQNPGAPGGEPPDIWSLVINAGTDADYLKIQATANGQIAFHANDAFWANFVVEVPMEKYRQILFKDPSADLRYISLHPATGALRAPPPFGLGGAPYDTTYSPIQQIPFDPAYPALSGVAFLNLSYVGAGNILNTLDRRVTIEVGCSLPLKNSPLIDHGVEAPDFVLGRYMFHKPYSMSTGATGLHIESESLGAQNLQGSGDRVCYHHLMPQQKINTLRLKLWARVRTYNEQTKTWGMQTIVCPVQGSDYWHVRLHFVEK